MTNFWNPYAEISPGKRRTISVSAMLAVLIVWTALSASGLMTRNQLPSPLSVAQAMSYLAWYEGRSQLLVHTMWSVGRVATASVLVIAVGIPLGVLMGSSQRINAFFSPLIDPFRSAPVAALLPIMAMWFGIGELMKIAFLFVGSIVYLTPLVRDAIRSVPEQYLVGAKDIGATQWECITKVLVPLAMPRIMDAVIVGVSVSWTYITVAEYVNAQEGLGQMIANAKRLIAMDQVFAGIIVIIAVALLTYQSLMWLKGRFFQWETKA
ncbi:ABC transporter permease [Verminephrobacter aporrectodeae]|uniref:ABC transporter permease n=1 Tax=Verminephrobacter aporrectodeae subsp. tuberculatae TaxID=1110392 RepID=A0ABT3KT75_9BURK|nr:ABC transporter permease [Verminephrobacter aporrectodeae]MCW5219924.1 ABC transporter permease [Verminephrobacter aporrectodeae subsp. tuberculatae]MCW5256083.1 ABC transporter permease [Verminephrobacter aporrectodeae subsp. tuberculatae]MCW5289212.1 ABC transporter permease [Verminephrobacter aporrectodeae subsp. tuberculatae]MCW5321124.1 ABC transporter permease [Verminephrobacter aporrectodeae subsp. tuberculatae]MCW8176041.1 ABC transporter permease [Verminephrobacter aporrectodeae su